MHINAKLIATSTHCIPETKFTFMQPDCTLSTTIDVKGFKKAKDRITVGLAVNSTGGERLKPIVIHKSKQPRCFGKTFNPGSVVSYYSNKKAWMCSEVHAYNTV